MKTIKRILAAALAMLLTLSTLVAGAVAAEPALACSGCYSFAHSTEKLIKTVELPQQPADGAWSFNLARNEREGFEFIWKEQHLTESEPTRTIRIEVSDFVGENGAKMEPKVYTMFYMDKFAHASDYNRPDPLIPYEGESIELTYEERSNGKVWNKCYYIEVVSEKDQPSGVYESSVRVYQMHGDGKETLLAEAPVKATVWNFTLPETHYSDTAFYIGWGRQAFYDLNKVDRNDEAAKHALRKQYYDFLLDHGVSAQLLPYTLDDPRADAYITDPRVTSFACTGGKAGYDKAVALGAKGKVYFYLADEIGSQKSLDEYNMLVDERRAIYGDDIHIVAPFYQWKFDKGWKPLEWGDMKYPTNVTGETYNQLAFQRGKSDIICPISSLFFDEFHPGFKKDLEEMKDDIFKTWWYVCTGPSAVAYDGVDYQFCNFFYAWLSTTGPRLLFWQQYQQNVDGLLYWDTVFWQDYNSGAMADPWDPKNPLGSNSGGDGVLIFPGPSIPAPYKQRNEPIATMRLKNITDGLDDFDYLKMHEKAFGREATDALLTQVTTSMMNTLRDKWPDTAYRGNHVQLAAVRDTVGQALSDYYTNPPHEHDYVGVTTPPTCTEQGYTTHTCACSDSYADDYVAALGHDWGEWEVTAPATENTEGVETRTCKRNGCGQTAARPIDILPHVHKYVGVATAPTCTEQGYTTYSCACNKSHVNDYVAALGHNWGDWLRTREPTPTVEGKDTRTCASCGAKETRPVDRTNPDKYIFTTKYKSNFWNWIMFFVLFGWIWMWFI